jgi:hypothetical protein
VDVTRRDLEGFGQVAPGLEVSGCVPYRDYIGRLELPCPAGEQGVSIVIAWPVERTAETGGTDAVLSPYAPMEDPSTGRDGSEGGFVREPVCADAMTTDPCLAVVVGMSRGQEASAVPDRPGP